MKSDLRLRLLGCALGVASPLFSTAADTANWTTWRGPSNQGIAPGATPPVTWSDQSNIKWKAKVPGFGFSTPIVWKDRIFLLSAIETTEERAAEAPVAAPTVTPGGP